ARHEPRAHRVGYAREDDGDGARCLLGRHGRRCARGHDDVDLELDQLRSERGELPDLPVREPIFDADVLPFDVAALAQPLPEGLELRREAGSAVEEEAYSAAARNQLR